MLRLFYTAPVLVLVCLGLPRAFGQSVDEVLSLTSSSDVLPAAYESLEPTVQVGSGVPSVESSPAADESFLGSLDDSEDYVPGRGLITLEGVSGMFLNPTSGTLPAGSLTAQHCTAILEQNDDTVYQHTTMVSYGLTDWFELGVFGRVNDRPDDLVDVGGGGPLARLRLLKDERWRPELSVGGMLREGHETVEKRTVFIAASKVAEFAENPLFFKTLRGHVGFRQLWQDSSVAEANGSVVYGGAEIELPYSLFLVGELSNKDDVFNHQPFAFGMQWRPNRVVGLSVAGVQSGGDDQVSLYVGIGLNFGLARDA